MSKNVPKIRFKGFSDDLTKHKFKELVTLQRGSSPRPIIKYITNSDKGVNWIKIGDVSKDTTIIEKTKEKITIEGAKKSRFVGIGDLILSNSMSFGRPYIMGIEGYIHDGWFVLKNYSEKFNRDYLCQLLISPAIQKQYKRLAAGGVVDNISSELVNSVNVNLPSLEEQERIANFLTKVDKLIEKQDEKVSNLEQYKKGMMQKIFSQEVRFKRDDGGEFSEWEEKRLRNICSINQGLQIAISDRFTEYKKGRYFYITNEFLRDNSEKKFYIENPNDSVLCNEGDILMTRTGNTGKVVTNVSGAFHNNFFKVNYDREKIVKEFIYYFLTSFKIQKTILRLAGTSTIPDLNHNDFYNIKIEIPCLEEQTKIANFLSNIDSILEKEKEKLEEMRKWKKGLLQGMFV